MIDRDTLRSLLGEGFHTAFRKAVDTATAAQIHRLIAGMPLEHWEAVLSFVADGFPSEVFVPDLTPAAARASASVTAIQQYPDNPGEQAAFTAGAVFARSLLGLLS